MHCLPLDSVYQNLATDIIINVIAHVLCDYNWLSRLKSTHSFP